AKLVEVADKKLIDERQRISMLQDKDEVGQQQGQQGRQQIQLSGGVSGATGEFSVVTRSGATRAEARITQTESNEVFDVVSNNRPLNGRDLEKLGSIGRIDAAAAAKEFADLQPSGQEPAVQVRSDFRSTVFWQPDVVTDKDGKAVVKVKFPDSL